MTSSNHFRFAEEAHHIAKQRVLRVIAVFEALKGIAALAAIIGLVDLMHHDIRHLVLELIGHFGLNPHAHYPAIMLHYAEQLPNTNMQTLILLASGYILIRLAEAYGLWNDLAWGEWLGALSGGAYIPFELIHLIHKPSFINAAVLVSNIVVVGFLTLRLWQSRSM